MDSLDVILGYISAELLGVVFACWIIGKALKQTPAVPDWTIVYIVSAVAILLSCAMQGFNVQSVIEGILCGAVAVYSNQLVKQGKKGIDGE